MSVDRTPGQTPKLMATKTKIDRGLYSIQKMISPYKDEAHIKIANEVVINEKKPELDGPGLYYGFYY